MNRAKAIRLAIGLRLIDRNLAAIPRGAIRKMSKGAQVVALAANHTDELLEIISAAADIGFEQPGLEAFLSECLHASDEFEPNMSFCLMPPAPPSDELYAAALGVLA